MKAIWQLQQDVYLTEQQFDDYDVDDISNVDMANTPFTEIQLLGREDAMDYAQQLKREGGRSAYAITKIINDNGYKVSQSTVTRWVRKDLL